MGESLKSIKFHWILRGALALELGCAAAPAAAPVVDGAADGQEADIPEVVDPSDGPSSDAGDDGPDAADNDGLDAPEEGSAVPPIDAEDDADALETTEVFVEPDISVDAQPTQICLTSQQCAGSSNPCIASACIGGFCVPVAKADGTPCKDCGFSPTCSGGVCVPVAMAYTKAFPAPGLDDPKVVLRTPKGAYYLVGERKVVPGNQDILIQHVGAAGKLLWEQSLNFAAIEVVTSATLDSEGLLIAGHFAGGVQDTWDAQLVRVGLDGQLVWRKVFGTASADRLFALVAVPGDGWLAAGELGPSGAKDSVKDSQLWALRVNGSGTTVQTLTYGTPNSDWALAVALAADGGWILAGQSVQGSAPADAIAVRTDADGKQLWQKQWTTPGWNRFTSAVTLPSGNIVLGGTFRGAQADSTYDAWLVRLSPEGVELNGQVSHPVPGIDRVVSLSATVTEAVDFLVVGTTDPEDTGGGQSRHVRVEWADGAVNTVECTLLGSIAAVALQVQGALSVVVGRVGAQAALQRSFCQNCQAKCSCSPEVNACLQPVGCACQADPLAVVGMTVAVPELAYSYQCSMP